MKKHVLFLCTGNACRSQMAEGWAKALLPDLIEPYSAGIERHALDPRAVAVMREAGVDISGQKSQLVSEFAGLQVDLVVTVCSHADQKCPAFPGATRVIHAPFDDPPKLAADAAQEEQALAPYRRVRDEIKAFVQSLPERMLLSD